MKTKILLIIFIFLSCGYSVSAIQRGIKIKTTEGKTIQLYDKSYALVIGISDYKNWKDLPNAVKDADAVAAELEKIGFEVTKITDNTYKKPTRANILEALNDLQNSSADDRIVIYYAGHGNSVPVPYQEGYYNGYIIPENARKDDMSSYVSMNNIKDITMMYQAKHVLYLFDCCFSGHFVDITRADNKPELIITEKISKPVRQVISAGTAEQEASDGEYHSPFCDALLDNFRNLSGDYNNDGYITGEELSFNIRQKVEYDTRGDQTPEYGKMKGFKEGDFVFAMSYEHRPIEFDDESKYKISQHFEDSDKKQLKEKDLYFIFPRVGFSSFSGFFGFELQISNLAIGAGTFIFHEHCFGLKILFNSHGSSWFIGPTVMYISEDSPRGEWEYGIGGVLGYRWLRASGWNSSVGLGLQNWISRNKKIDFEIRPTCDFTIGYFF